MEIMRGDEDMKFRLLALDMEQSEQVKLAYYTKIGHTIDDFFRNVILGKAKGYEIRFGDQTLGSCFITDDGELVQWWMDEESMPMAQAWMWQVLFEETVKSALVSTREPLFLSLCLEFQESIAIDSYLFESREKSVNVDPPLEGCVFEEATEEEMEICQTISREPFAGYYASLRENQGLFVVKTKGKIIGTGELRMDDMVPGFADLGMVTHPEFRKRGVATYVIANLLVKVKERGLQANAACDFSNIGSRKTLEKAGMMATHRMVKIRF
jgi:RimJ/RimL family protein N-acetyltransferase